LADTYLVRDAETSQEISNVTILGKDAESNDLILDLEPGDYVKIKTKHIDDDRLYVILKKTVKRIGNLLTADFRLSKMNEESFGRVGNSLPIRLGV